MSDYRSELLATAFERKGDQWVWYGNAFAKGVIVTSEERDIYLAFNPLGFRRAIKGRTASIPRRPYLPTVKRLLIAMVKGRDPSQP